MKKDDPFYIGWQDEMPSRQKSLLKKTLVPVFIVLPLLTLLIVWLQNPYNNHQFTLGNIQTVTGVYFDKPVPMLQSEGESVENILLVGYGKFGAEGIIKDIEKESGSLNGKRVALQGTLISGDGKTLLELTKKSKSLDKIIDPAVVEQATPSAAKSVQLTGEILDPKCYFGVMKPGEGKSHKSCAIRCISGGIPPVFRTGPKDDYQYFILLGKDGEKINKALLPFVAEQIQLSGSHQTQQGWDVLYVDSESIVKL